jgi:hypothetical protein
MQLRCLQTATHAVVPKYSNQESDEYETLARVASTASLAYEHDITSPANTET